MVSPDQSWIPHPESDLVPSSRILSHPFGSVEIDSHLNFSFFFVPLDQILTHEPFFDFFSINWTIRRVFDPFMI